MKQILIVFFLLSVYSCKQNNKTTDEKDKKIEELNSKVDQLLQQQASENSEKQKEIQIAKEKKDKENKELIIGQIKSGQGIIITPNIEPIGMGGVKGSFNLENALSGVTFSIINVQSIVYLSNGSIYSTQDYTFTNVKSGETRTRNLQNTGSRGSKCEIIIKEIQSNWLTDGKPIKVN